MKVLLIAEAANPEWTSVPLIGWSLSQALRAEADCHLLTHERNRAALERASLTVGREFTPINSDLRALHWHRLGNWLRGGAGVGWTTEMVFSGLMHRAFEQMAWEQFGAALRAGEFDLVHRITPVSPTVVSPLAARCAAIGVPFLLGPLNGGVPWPAGFDSARRREKEWLSYVRGVYKLMPGHRAMLRAAARIMVGSRHTEADLPPEVRAKTLYLPENGVDPQRFPLQARGPFTAPLRAVFVGRLVPYKGPDMLLEAAEPLLRSGAMRLDILGDGPMAGELRAWVAQRGLEAAVTLHGFVENQRVKDILGSSHVLAFPSVREFGGGVVLEAMAMGVVPLVVDYAGPGELVDAAVGFKVPIGPRAAIVQGFRARLTTLSADPAALAPLSAAARTRVMEQFTWAAKARQIKAIYEQVVAEAAARRAA